MSYVITRDPKDANTCIIRTKEDDFILAMVCPVLLSNEILDYIDRDGYAEVSFKLHFGEKE